MYESFSMNLFINMPIIDFIISKQRRQLTSAFVKVLPAELKASAKFSTCIILFSLTLRTKNSWSIPVKSLQFPSLSSVQSFPTTKISQNNPVLSNWTQCVIDWQPSLDKQWPKQKLNAGFSETLRLRASCQKTWIYPCCFLFYWLCAKPTWHTAVTAQTFVGKPNAATRTTSRMTSRSLSPSSAPMSSGSPS